MTLIANLAEVDLGSIPGTWLWTDAVAAPTVIRYVCD